MQDEINKLTEENIHLKFENKQYKEKYEGLEEKTNYLVNHLNKVFEKLPEFIQKIVEKLFNNKVLSLFSFKHDYDSEERKANQEFVRKHNLFKKREIEKSTKHLNNEMDEAAEEFYQTKKDKKKTMAYHFELSSFLTNFLLIPFDSKFCSASCINLLRYSNFCSFVKF